MATPTEDFAEACQFHSNGNLALAEQYCWLVLGAEPSHSGALHLLGVIAHQKGDLQQAIDYLNRSLLCDGSCAEAWNDLGDLHLAGGQVVDAIANYEQALRLKPDFAKAYNNLGTALRHIGNVAGAVDCFQALVSLTPGSAEAYNNLGNALWRQGKIAEAGNAYQQAMRLDPSRPEIAHNLGLSRHELGDLDQAVAYYKQALRLKANYADATNNLATALKEQGLFVEAITQYRQTLALQPDHALAMYNLSELAADGRYSFTPNEFDRIRAFIASDRCAPLERSLCCFALAAVHDRNGYYDEAFGYFQEANELRRRLLLERNEVFDLQRHRAVLDRVIGMYDRSYFDRVARWGTPTRLPVFIVGMPRSGSTLVEQILASHPNVFGAGEHGDVPRYIVRTVSEAGAEPYLNPVPPNEAAARTLATTYLREIAELGRGASRVTIKSLDNYIHLGLIVTLFPNARIIHCRRDPRDVCTSCYFQNFKDLTFAWSLADIGNYYVEYERLMAHWAQVLPGRIHEVRYESLVNDQEGVTRDLLTYCGLDWDERCLTFFKTRRVVRTASAVQVRKPISTRSVGRWKHYRKHMTPLWHALAPTLANELEASSGIPEAIATSKSHQLT